MQSSSTQSLNSKSSQGFNPPAHLLKKSKARQEKIKTLNGDRAKQKDEPKPSPKLERKQKGRSKSANSSSSSLNGNETRKKATETPEPPANPSTLLNFSSKTLTGIQQIQQAREERRAKHAEERKRLEGLTAADQASLVFRDYIYDFKTEFEAQCDELGDQMLNNEFANSKTIPQIRVCVRKRPMNSKELEKNHFDVISVKTASFPFAHVYVHEPKSKVDMSKHVEHHQFVFDNSFDEHAHNQLIYKYTARPLVESFLKGGKTTFFAYGQTGSGKTHTIFGKKRDPGVFVFCCQDIWTGFEKQFLSSSHRNVGLFVSFFEIYGGKIFDLLNEKSRVELLEDGNGNFIVDGLTHVKMEQLGDLLRVHEIGSQLRTTGSTEANASSSRSHAVFQIAIVDQNHPDAGTSKAPTIAKFSLVDLAGSERGAETGDNIPRQSRIEGADINKSLLALKECIRLLYHSQQRQAASSNELDGNETENDGHIPFRASKLTQILRDSLICKNSKTVMMATISPSDGVVEHSLNTLRYADRVKQLKQSQPPASQQAGVHKNLSSHFDAVLASDRKVTSSNVAQINDILNAKTGSLASKTAPSNEDRKGLSLSKSSTAKPRAGSASSSGSTRNLSKNSPAPRDNNKKKTASHSSKNQEQFTSVTNAKIDAESKSHQPVEPKSAGNSSKSQQASRNAATDRLVKSHRKIFMQEEQLNSLQKKLLQEVAVPNYEAETYVSELEDLLLAKIDLIRALMKELSVCKQRTNDFPSPVSPSK